MTTAMVHSRTTLALALACVLSMLLLEAASSGALERVVTLSGASNEREALLHLAEALRRSQDPTAWMPLMPDVPSADGRLGHSDRVTEASLGQLVVSMGLDAVPHIRTSVEFTIRTVLRTAATTSYKGQVFEINVDSAHGELTTMLLVARRLQNDGQAVAEVWYLFVHALGSVRQQYTPVRVHTCHRCPRCGWLSKCCCHDTVEWRARGLTPQEVMVIGDRLSDVQHDYVVSNIHSLPADHGAMAALAEMAGGGAIQRLGRLEASYEWMKRANLSSPLLRAAQIAINSYEASGDLMHFDDMEKRAAIEFVRSIAPFSVFSQDDTDRIASMIELELVETTLYQISELVLDESKGSKWRTAMIVCNIDTSADGRKLREILFYSAESTMTFPSGSAQPLRVTRVGSISPDGRLDVGSASVMGPPDVSQRTAISLADLILLASLSDIVKRDSP